MDTPAQVASWLDRVLPADLHDAWPRTEGGQLTSRAPVLKLHLDVPAVPELLAVRKMRKLLGAFGSTLLDKVHPITGRLHPGFLVAGARTGRFSSRNPNLQQMPKRQLKAFRNSFTAPPGRVLVVADYSQIELRVAAELSGDETMLAAYRSGLDLHTRTARGVSGQDASVRGGAHAGQGAQLRPALRGRCRDVPELRPGRLRRGAVAGAGGSGPRGVLRHLPRLACLAAPDSIGGALRWLRADGGRPALALGMGCTGLVRRGRRTG